MLPNKFVVLGLKTKHIHLVLSLHKDQEIVERPKFNKNNNNLGLVLKLRLGLVRFA